MPHFTLSYFNVLLLLLSFTRHLFMHNNAIKERLNMVLIFSCDWLLTNWMQFYFFVPISSFSVSSLFLWSHWRFTCEQVKINTLKLTLFFGPCAPLCRNMRTSEGILSLSLSLERKKTHSLLQDHKWMHTLHKLNYTFIQTRSTRLLKHIWLPLAWAKS